MNLENNLKVIGKLMKSWPGESLDSRATVRLLNPSGGKPPLFWVFNSASEPVNLAKALGPDQPLIYARSLHLVLPTQTDPSVEKAELGAYYAQVLDMVLDSSQMEKLIWVGANCQASMIGMHVAARMLERGKDVLGICLISALPKMPINLPALLLYGENDPNHDPFCNDRPSAEVQALATFTRYRRQILNGLSHGEYFRLKNVDRLAGYLLEFRDEVRQVTDPEIASANSEIVGL